MPSFCCSCCSVFGFRHPTKQKHCGSMVGNPFISILICCLWFLLPFNTDRKCTSSKISMSSLLLSFQTEGGAETDLKVKTPTPNLQLRVLDPDENSKEPCLGMNQSKGTRAPPLRGPPLSLPPCEHSVRNGAVCQGMMDGAIHYLQKLYRAPNHPAPPLQSEFFRPLPPSLSPSQRFTCRKWDQTKKQKRFPPQCTRVHWKYFCKCNVVKKIQGCLETKHNSHKNQTHRICSQFPIEFAFAWMTFFRPLLEKQTPKEAKKAGLPL